MPFTQLSDGLLEARPKPPERISVLRPNNAMGMHANSRLELAMGSDLSESTTVGELTELLYHRLALSRRQRIILNFWGKELSDASKTLMDYRLITNSELMLTTAAWTHMELAELRQATPLRKVRIASNKVAAFDLIVTAETTAGELRKAVHAHLHTPITFIAVENWKPEADTLVFKRGHQLVKASGGGGGGKKDKGGMVMTNLHTGTVGGVAAAESLVECRVELADVRVFYGGLPLAEESLVADLGVLHDDLVFVDIKRPFPFDRDPEPLPAKAEKKGKADGKGKKK
ncbi:hypothetical protein T492DRAFT_1147526 [Pavlovales sp. CCMP2436]|nr:hypothetical protein T492DRAFT_1147526 [Pavlovales sp. CCMP2436]